MTETPPPTDPPTSAPPAGGKLTEYVISWKWLLGGLFLLLFGGSAIGGLYYYRSVNMANHVRGVATQMVAEADEIWTEFEAETDNTRKQQLFLKSRKIKEDAAKLLDNFSRAQRGHNTPILKELNAILESLYENEGGGRERGQQLSDNCSDLIQALASAKESLPYHIRMMQLAWDRRDLQETLARARQVLTVERELNYPENYEAQRYIALVAMLRLSVVPYSPESLQMPFLENKLSLERIK